MKLMDRIRSAAADLSTRALCKRWPLPLGFSRYLPALESVRIFIERERHEYGRCNCCGSRYRKGSSNDLADDGRTFYTLCPQCLWTLEESACLQCESGKSQWCENEPLFLHEHRVLSFVDRCVDAQRRKR